MKTILTLMVSLILLGCKTTSFESYTYDASTDKSTRVVYSEYFNGWSYIVENEIAIEAAIELQPEAVDRTGLFEKVLQAQLHLFLYNQTSDKQTVGFSEVKVIRSDWIDSTLQINKSIDLPPMSVDRASRVQLVAIELPISFYEDQISIAGEVDYFGLKKPFSISLNRLTREDLKKAAHEYRNNK